MAMRTGRFPRLGYALILLAIALGMAACGQTTVSLSGSSSGQPSSSGAPTATPHGTTMTPGSATTGVTLTLNQQRYSADSLILVTIHNGSQQTIWAADHQTSCTVLRLERQAQGSWTRVGQCALATPTRMIPIAPGADFVQRLTSQQEMDSGAGWPVGAYRVALSYHLGNDSTSLTSGETVYSPEFTIA